MMNSAYLPQFSIRAGRLLRWPLTLLMLLSLSLVACSDDDDDGDGSDEPGGGSDQSLVIEQGSQSVEADGSNKTADVNYMAVLVDAEGNKESVEATWSVENSDVASISASGQLSVAGGGVTFVKASFNRDGVTWEAKAPLRVELNSLFSVAPWSAIVVPGEDIPLEPVFLNPTASATFSASSSDNSIVSITSNSLSSANIGFKGEAAGEAIVTVTAETSDGESFTADVPVLVLGTGLNLPITRVSLTPRSNDMFRGDTKTLEAKAFNANDEEQTASFSWSSSNEAIVSVDQNGQIAANTPGEATIRAETNGITGEANVKVLPDTVVVVNPISASAQPGEDVSFTATVYDAKKVFNGQANAEITSHANINWSVPNFPFPGGELFNVGSISSTSGTNNVNATLSVSSSVSPGTASFVQAQVGSSPFAVGAANVTIAIGTGGPDCSTGDPNVDQINVTNGNSVTLNPLTGNGSHQIELDALDDSGSQISNPNLVFHSDNTQVATVSSDGFVQALGNSGKATITICGPNAQATVTVTVN